MKSELIKTSQIKSNPNNPRVIKDDKFEKLVKSIKEFPKMLELRPIVVNNDMIVLGGNMRLKACKEAGLKQVHIIKASELTEEEQREFILKDNVGFGEWDWDRVGGPEYRIPGATDRKYIDTFVTRTQSDRDMWKVYDNVSSTDTVFNWHPNPFDPPMIYVFGNQHWPAEIRASVEYHVPGATVKKYMDDIRTTRLSDKNKFTCLYPCEFDWSWEPNPGDPPYIYVFGNQWWPAEKMATVEYHVPDAIERKFMDQPATLLSNKNNWSVPDNVDPLSIDYSWVPDPGDPPYTYVFGNQHWPGEIMPTVEYHVPGATECKYIDYIRITLTECMDNWEILEEIAHDEWDWSWIPNPLDPPYIYVFGNQWNPPEFKASVKYVVPGASEVKYMDRRTRRLPTPKLFRHNLAVSKFDYSWEPNPFDPPMMYVFGNQWNSAVLEPTVATGLEILIITVAVLGTWQRCGADCSSPGVPKYICKKLTTTCSQSTATSPIVQ